MFPKNAVWVGHDGGKAPGKNPTVSGGWLTKINYDLKKIANTEAIQKGEAINNITTPCGRVYVSNMNTYYISLNTTAGIYKAIYIGITLHAVGRAGETGWAT
jgi:hypothetical protein